MSLRSAALCLLTVTLPAAASAQARLGTEFRVSTYWDQGSSYLASPAITRGPHGDLLVVWSSYGQDGSGSGVFGQRMLAGGERVGREFRVNTFTDGHQAHPAIGPSVAGGTSGYVVVWTSEGQDGSNGGVFGQRYDAAGAAVGGEFRINACTGGDQREPDVAEAPDGGFIVVWSESGNVPSVGCPDGIVGRRYDAAGRAHGGAFSIHQDPRTRLERPHVASDAAGNFVVVWQEGVWDIVAQRFAASGDKKGFRFLVNTTVSDVPFKDARVAVSAGGDFVVAWSADGPSVRARRFDAGGWPLGAEFEVGSAARPPMRVSVAFDERRGFLVTWADGQVFARRYDADGVAGSALRVIGDRNWNLASTVALDGAGDFVVAWASSPVEQPRHKGIYAQRLSGAAAPQ